MIIDAHMHVNFRGFSAEAIVKYLDKHRIDCCWLLTWEESNPGKWPYQHLPVEDVLDAYSKYPSRIIPMYAPDPARDDAGADLESWHRRGIRGCGELKATLNWGSPGVRRLLKSAGSLGMPVVFHMEDARELFAPRSSAVVDRLLSTGLQSTRLRYAILRRFLRASIRVRPMKGRIERVPFPGYMVDFGSLEKALIDFPDVSFVAHGPMFWRHISAEAVTRREMYPRGSITAKGVIWRLLADYGNLYADTSAFSGLNALRRDPASAKRFLSLYEDKLLYGTDNYSGGQKRFLDSLGLSRRTYAKIYGENAIRLACGRVSACKGDALFGLR